MGADRWRSLRGLASVLTAVLGFVVTCRTFVHFHLIGSSAKHDTSVDALVICAAAAISILLGSIWYYPRHRKGSVRRGGGFLLAWLTKQVAGLICLAGIIGVFVFGWQLWHAIGDWAAGGPSFDVRSSSIALTGYPGKPVKFDLTGATLGGNENWASSTGLTLNLAGERPAFNGSYAIVPAKAAAWGDSISVCEPSCGDDSFTIPVEFTLPSNLAEAGARTLSGTLSGDFSYPEDAGNGTFQNADTQLRIPVTLRLGADNGIHRELAISFLGLLISVGAFWALGSVNKKIDY